MATLSLSQIKASSVAKDTEEKRKDNRDKAMLLFTFQFLLDKGYVDSAASLASECSLNLDQYTICENIDMHSILVDYEAYYSLRFQRQPQYYRKVSGTQGSETVLEKLRLAGKNKPSGGNGDRIPNNRSRKGVLISEGEIPHSGGCGSGEIIGNGLKLEPVARSISNPDRGSVGVGIAENKLLKPISGLEFPNEDTRAFAELIQKEIVVQDLNTKWEDVVGLENAKMILMESLSYRAEFIDFFGQALPPWRGLLLYGPPGTGKTLLARAVASETGSTFFNISSAALISKWRGDSEKIVKVLFDLAKYHAPSTIFFDEFDALASNRDSLGETDASRRLKSELLQQIDGLLSSSSTSPQQSIFVLAATNLPWNLDPAMIRRMEKRVYIPLPGVEGRREILKLNFNKTAIGISQSSLGRNQLSTRIDYNKLAQVTEGYSGSDLQQVVKETIVGKFRQHLSTKIKKLLVETEDVLEALQSVSPTLRSNISDQYSAWEAAHRKHAHL